MRRWIVTCIAAIAFPGVTVAADAIRQPLAVPTTALERQLLDDAVDGAWQRHSLLQAALVAGGMHDDARLQAYTLRFESAADQVLRESAALTSDRDRAATVLTVLHRHFLTGRFDPHCAELAATFDRGQHNCVTAAILFRCLADVVQVPVSILHAPGHVRVRVEGQEPFELEPTCASWFRQEDARLLPWSTAPREISAVALVGKLYYNQGVKLLEERQFSTAAAALNRSLLLDPADHSAQHNLLAALNNGALQRVAERDYKAAAALLQSAKAIDPQYPPLASNELHLLGQWTIAQCNAHDYPSALTTVEQAAALYPQSDLARGGPAAVYRLWAEALAQKGERHAALARVEAGLALSPDSVELQRLKQRLRSQ